MKLNARMISRNQKFDKRDVLVACAGREEEIATNVGGIPRELLDGRHHACPKCGGADRFRWDRQKKFAICNACFKEKNGNVLAAVSWMLNMTQSEDLPKVLNRIGNYLDLQCAAPTSHVDIIDRVCAAKRMPRESLLAFGAESAKRGRLDVVRIPAYGPDGVPHTHFDLVPNKKGWFAKDGGVGMFFPGRMPKPGEAWCIVEGCKDSAALTSLGLLAAGLPSSSMGSDFAQLFAGCEVLIVPDLDAAGLEGAKKSAARLFGIAANVRIARLPGEMRASGGCDVRDVLAKQGGEDLVRAAIERATPWEPLDKPPDELEFPPTDRNGQPQAEQKTAFNVIAAAELAASDYAVTYLVKDVLVEGQPCIVAGPPKTLKTSVLVDLALNVSMAGRFLQHFKVKEARRVCMMSGESGLAALRSIAMRVAEAAGRSLADYSNVVFTDRLPRLGHQEDLEAVRELLTENEIAVLLVDPAYLCLPAGAADKAGNLFAMGAVLRGISEVCQGVGCTLILAHHTRKTGQSFNPPELSDIAWSGFAEWARQWILLNQREPFEEGQHRLWMRVGGSSGHFDLWGLDVDEGRTGDPGGRKWAVTLRTADACRVEESGAKAAETRRKAAKVERDRAAVQEVLTDEVQTLRQIRLQAKLGQDKVEMLLLEMLSQGEAVRTETRSGGRTTSGWKRPARK